MKRKALLSLLLVAGIEFLFWLTGAYPSAVQAQGCIAPAWITTDMQGFNLLPPCSVADLKVLDAQTGLQPKTIQVQVLGYWFGSVAFNPPKPLYYAVQVDKPSVVFLLDVSSLPSPTP